MPAAHPPRHAPSLWKGAGSLLSLLVVAAAGAARAQADAPGSGGALALAADPPRLVLGRDQGADLRIAAPPEVAEIAVTASAGRVDGIRRLPGGGFTARYHPPAERFPQVGIVVAMGRAGGAALDGWLAVPLAGQGDARVKGSPGDDVSLRIGDQSFGPERVGADGVAVIPVVVPPGVREGHQGFTAVDLKVPETSLVHAVLERPTAQADRPEAVRFLAFVVAPHGAARKGEAPLLEPTRGTAVVRPREPGAWEGTWTLPPGATGEERLTVRLDGFPASRVTLKLSTVAGPASAVALSLDRSVLVAGTGVEVHVTARALDAAGNAAPGAVELSADAGALVQVNAEPGVARGVFHAGPWFGGRNQAIVRARIPSTGASAQATVALQPSTPLAVELRPDAAYLRADGKAEAELSLQVLDEFGNAAAGSPRMAASAGAVPRLEPLGPGRWRVRYRADAVDAPVLARVQAEAGDARGEAGIWLVPPPSRQLAFLGGAGLVGTGPGLLAAAELPLPEWFALPPERALGLRVEFLATAHDRQVTGGNQTERGVALLAGPVLKGLRPGFRWFASGTLGLLAGSAEPPGAPSRNGMAPALRLGLGVSAPLGRTAPFLELGVLGAAHAGGSFSALMLTLGVRHDMVRPGSDEHGE